LRRAALFRELIFPKAAYILAVDLGGENGIRVALMDLFNDIVEERLGPKIELLKGKELNDALSITINGLIKEINVPKDKILGVCIGVPGIIDFKLKKYRFQIEKGHYSPLSKLGNIFGEFSSKGNWNTHYH